MRISGIVSLIVLSLAILAGMAGTSGCANIIPPGGGPRDSLPPVLVKATPRDSTLGFSANRMTFTFDEYVDLDNYEQNLIISPVPENRPTVSRNLQTVTVRLRDSLEANTTYTFDFGNSIKDINEGNVFRNFTYIFSTGNYFDTLTVKGNIILAENGETDTTLTLMLHRSGEDSALLNQKPRYIARPDNKGNFIFRNLAPGSYYVYALKDESRTYRYMDKSVLFAFASEPVRISNVQPAAPVTLYAYAEPKDEKTGAGPTTAVNVKAIKPEDRRIKFTTNLEGDKHDLLKPFTIEFGVPLRTFDSAKVHISTDTTYTPVTGYSWQPDSLLKKFSLIYNWPENTRYNIILEKEFATDTLGFQLFKTDTLHFTTKRLTEYGKLNLRFRNLDKYTHPVLQFVQNKMVVKSYPLTSNTLNVGLFVPGDYELRVLDDQNQNGVWDPGTFFGTRRQPELVKPLQRKLTIKAGVDVPVEIDLSDIRLPGSEAAPGPGIGAPGQFTNPAQRQQPALPAGNFNRMLQKN